MMDSRYNHPRFWIQAWLYLAGLFVLALACFVRIPSDQWFYALFFATLFVAPPQRAISPLSILYVYYAMWFVMAPLFAASYQNGELELIEYRISFLYAFCVFGSGALIFKWFELTIRSEMPPSHAVKSGPEARTILWLYFFATSFVVGIVMASGGLSVWVADPGDAFLNRGGSGVYVIGSHFSSLTLALASGYYAVKKKAKWPIFLFLTWVLVTSPVHGSKFQISLLIILMFSPWLCHVRAISLRSVSLAVGLIAVFVLGLYFRNFTWIEADTFLPYAMNYFTALANLAMSLRDFEPDFLKTFFLPFVKFTTPFGLSNPSEYYDMNHYLTDIYFPEAWATRATEQWPVETDLYLNFGFYGGLPLVWLYFIIIAYIYRRALESNSLGLWFGSLMTTMLMISHLRGSLINHTDFYMYPFIFFVVIMWRHVYIPRSINDGRKLNG